MELDKKTRYLLDAAAAAVPLVDAMRSANAAAIEASRIPDGGTCNLDSVVLRMPKGYRSTLVIAAAREAGISATETTWFGRGWFLNFDASGQGNAHTAGVEAARKIMEACGYACSIYYQMD